MTNTRRNIRLVVLVLVLTLVMANPIPVVQAASIIVDTTTDDNTTNGNCSLREAIISANTDTAVDNCPAGGGADTIILSAGTYTLTIPGSGEDAAATGDLDVYGDLTITGVDQTTTIIDGAGIDRVFEVHSGSTVDISGVTVRNGSVNGFFPDDDGGGIANDGTLTVMDSTVSDNTATGWGAGIDNQGELTLTDSTVTANTSQGYGGGISNFGDLTLTRSTISGNNTAAGGAGVASQGTLTLTDSTVSGNTSQGYGGGFYSGGTVTLIDSTVSANVAGGSGGGISQSTRTMTIINSNISDNTAGYKGGGIYSREGAPVTIVDSTISGNSSNDGGAVYNGDVGTIRIANKTITDNSADNGDGIFDSGFGTVAIANSTISGNSSSTNGGGIFNGGYGGDYVIVMIVNSTITDNSAEANGGGISNGGTLTLTNSIISDNDANRGGGIFNNNGTATITYSIVSRNFASVQGGGIEDNYGVVFIKNSTISENIATAVGGGITHSSTEPMTIVDSTISGNTTDGPGGGIFNNLVDQAQPLNIVSCTISGNSAADSGGIAVDAGPVTILNSTISGNTASVRGGGIGYAGGFSEVMVVNTILALNTAPDGPDCSVSATSLGHNIVGDTTDCTMPLLPSDIIGDPGLSTFTDDGTPGHGYFPLVLGSPAVDMGDNVVCPDTDQLGQPRADGDGDGVVICDIGAYEVATVVPVDIRPSVCPNPLNVRSKGVLPVAILGTANLDVTQVDPASVELAGVFPLRWAVKDVATPYEPFVGKEDADDCTKEGQDGYMDLTLNFDTQEIVAALGPVNDDDVLVLSLTGSLLGGEVFAGEDVVRIINKTE